MNQRLSRSAIRRDELVEGLNKGFEFTHHHLRQILIALGAVGLVGLAWLGWRSWQGSGQARANRALAEAQEVYAAPVAVPGEAPPASGPHFPSAEARRDRAEELFTALRREHRGVAADAAAVYLARIALEKGDSAQAERLWREVVASESDSMLSVLARLDLVRLDRSQGRAEQALQSLEGMLRDDSRPVPDDVVLYELGATLQVLERPAEARVHLQRILDEFPRSSYRSAAQQAIAALPPPAPGSPAASPAAGS